MLIVCLALASVSCGGGDVGRTTGGPLIDDTGRGERTPRAHDAPDEGAPAISGRPYASTPITEFAEAMTDLALAAVEGRPLPTSPVPLRHSIDGAPEVEWSEHLRERPRRITVIGIAFELELILKRGTPPEGAEGAARFGSVRATVALSRNGLRLVELRPRAMTPEPLGGAPPRGLEGLPALARQLVSDLRQGDIHTYDITESDRVLLGDDAVWAEAQELRLIHARIPEIRRLLEGLPDEPLAYHLDEVGILARDDQDRLLSLAMDFDPRDGSFALSTQPLVEVRRLWPREP